MAITTPESRFCSSPVHQFVHLPFILANWNPLPDHILGDREPFREVSISRMGVKFAVKAHETGRRMTC
ncbi:hypothetical protein AGR1A_Cc40258 [Agrobacterium fabacearum CFBP 5771]|nr:hypothetical protein AGR1A_Cc40258 [Agrobacterium fabacearum CFBP 5771]